MRTAPLLLAAILSFASACATTQGAVRDGWFHRKVTVKDEDGEHRFDVAWKTGHPGRAWADAGDKAADFSYWNSEIGATIYGDTHCGDLYDDAPLTVLANHLFFGFQSVKTLSQEEAKLGDRAAVQRVSTGTLDGKPVQVGVTVVKKGPCVFDMVYIAAPHTYSQASGDYGAFVAGFDVRVQR